MTDLGDLGGGFQNIAYGINSSGQVAGYSDIAFNTRHAFVYSGGTMSDLGHPGRQPERSLRD